MASTLRPQQDALADAWRQGLSGQEILHRSATLVDDFIVDTYKAASAVQKARGKIAVIALGGYGRSELYPYSDIDLLLLHDWWSKKSMQQVVEAILYPLWDEGFEVGHSVRGVKDAIAFAQEDFHFQVALLDARLLTGSEELFEELKNRYTKKILDGRRHQFVETMEQHIQERLQKYGSHTYLLEPHVKEGKGGLRDIQAMMWVAKGVFGLNDLAAIESSGMLEPGNRQALEESWSMLAKIRNHIHLLNRRKGDHLIFELQEETASALDYKDEPGQLGVEHFMGDVYGHLQTISRITDLFFEHVHEVLGLTSGANVEQKLERSIVVRGGTIRLTAAEELTERPYLLMRLFLQAGRSGYPLHHRTRQMVTANLEKVDDHFRHSKRVSRVFIELLSQSNKIFDVLEAMLSTGLLTQYIPEFSGVESLAQHDLYHLYTVDRHSLQAVAELNNLKQSYSELFAELESPEVLYLAALLHDIGKGKQSDHSVLGAEMVEDIGKRLHLAENDRETLAFLIRYHLYLPENAMRRDFTDREFIHQASELVGDVQRLTMLYLLTIADSKATGPSAWSDWKASLLSELYLSLKSCLGADCHVEQISQDEEEQGVRWLQDQITQRMEGKQTSIDIDSLPSDYLLSYSLEAVERHLEIHTELSSKLRQQVKLFAEAGTRSWTLLIMGPDKVGLLAKFCGVLALHNLSVLSAEIFTWPDNIVVDTIEVVPSSSVSFEEQDWAKVEQDLNLAINYRLDVGYQLHERSQPQSYRSQRQVQQLERKVVIDNTTSQQYTLVEVYGGDNRSALYQLTQTLADFGLTIHRARIATEVEQLIVIFYVSTQTGTKLEESSIQEKISMTLMRIIGADDAELETASAS
ncbi:[protein-PII] uridylyltransferase [Desulfobulbus rhabdoformis]|uniref:[protein-PII] uridylyltransferase n=1 Tax=Desulfobulbus rhabdoformis TaxID=34032 RepID=UPI001966CDDE|nr:[protein-PII] uridylyltransferase [Desulfobulbus rhabdoformis]MBM9615139.1 [protein-PII] uridylyltransferase [Desulfobulbus rhabdoformis]